jgi:beta-phosphoglucomutase family hydrolase
MKYRALLFDMDGTLVHNMPTHNQAWKDTLAEAGVHVDLEEFNHATVGKTNREILRLMLGAELSESDIQYWGGRKENLYRARFAHLREPLPGLQNLLEQARGLGLLMAVATAAPPDNISFILDELDLRRYFQVVVGAHNVQHGKPHPDLFLKSAEALEVEPTACLVFEDALNGLEGARRAGMKAILICTTLDSQAVLGQSHVLQAVPDFTHIDLPSLLQQSIMS